MSSFLRKEILEQPAVLRELLEQERENVQQIAQAIRDYNPSYILLAARGSSDNAARYGQYLFGAINKLPVALASPSLYTLYKTPPKVEGALVIAISQSGQSPDIVSVVEEGQKQGALTIAITNDDQSPLAKAAAHTIRLHAGAEKSVAATKTYTTSLMALAMISSALSDEPGRLDQLDSVPDLIRQITDDADATLEAASRYRYMEACVVISRGFAYTSAYELALKLKELTYVLAEPYSSADFQHGPVALVAHGFPVIAVMPEGELQEELTAFLAELKSRGAELVVISSYEPALELAQTRLPVPAGIPEWILPIVAIVRGQLFAMGLTEAKGYNVDQPRGIHKVTLTE